jgi:glycosyltransferase involved in cell wall biosynthesis
MHEIMISIITATYNSAETINDTIKSVLCQTNKDFEYIIVDGGSTDETIDIVKSYESEFSGRLKWVSEKDKGIYDAMNKGIKMASGDIIGILNSDDYYTSDDILQTIADAFKCQNVDAIYGDIHFIKDGLPDKCVRYYSSRLFSPFWLRFGFMPAHPSFYCKREVFDKSGLYRLDYKIGSDYEMMVRLFRKHKISSRYVPKDFVTMRTGGASNSNLQSRLTLIKEDVKACRDNGIYTNELFICLKFLYKIFEFRVFC